MVFYLQIFNLNTDLNTQNIEAYHDLSTSLKVFIRFDNFLVGKYYNLNALGELVHNRVGNLHYTIEEIISRNNTSSVKFLTQQNLFVCLSKKSLQSNCLGEKFQ